MTIKDVIKISATMLGRDNVLAYLDDVNPSEADTQTLTVVDNLTRCANIVISELAFTFLPMTIRETVESINGKVQYSTLTEKVLDVKVVEDEYGNEISYKIQPTHLLVNTKKVVVEYTYLPSNYDLSDVIGYKETDVTPQTLALGVISEYLLIERCFDESVMWRQRYTDAINAICIPKNKTIKRRAWL